MNRRSADLGGRDVAGLELSELGKTTARFSSRGKPRAQLGVGELPYSHT